MYKLRICVNGFIVMQGVSWCLLQIWASLTFWMRWGAITKKISFALLHTKTTYVCRLVPVRIVSALPRICWPCWETRNKTVELQCRCVCHDLELHERIAEMGEHHAVFIWSGIINNASKSRGSACILPVDVQVSPHCLRTMSHARKTRLCSCCKMSKFLCTACEWDGPKP